MDHKSVNEVCMTMHIQFKGSYRIEIVVPNFGIGFFSTFWILQKS